ncbi:MAG: PVC-type heme-binding CxxCH protein [Verrucomicrobiota bacterium]
MANFISGRKKAGRLIMVWAAILNTTASTEEPRIEASALPRILPQSPEEALTSFQIKQGFSIELAASEPLTTDPVAISFDGAGRLFTCEMRGYSERREAALGRIRMLTDDDGDGRYDRATTYAEGLKWPTAILCWDGGVFVGATPDIWYFKDKDGDGIADEKRVVFTGFGEGSGRLNVQGLLNSFNWGPDWRIHGTASRHGGMISRPEASDAAAVPIRNTNFSFDPLKMDLRAEPGQAQYGMTFDDEGLRYVCQNSSHLEAVLYQWPWNRLALPDPRAVIPVDGGAAEVYRTSRVEPWRVVRTRWRVQGRVGGPIEGGGRDSGYFTSASGLTIYRGHAFPPGYRGNAFVGDVGSNLVHRKLITRDSNRVHLSARRPGDEARTEFLTSTDNWFRPVQCQNGPDGCLYLVDMYRETIEHPLSLPQPIKKHLDLNSGFDRGRIWRVRPTDKPLPATPLTAGLKVEELTLLLSHPNAWTREMAAQQLHARSQVDGLQALLDDPDETARFQAHQGLAAHRRLTKDHVAKALRDPSPLIRQHALRQAAHLAVSPEELSPRAADPDPWVRFELALLLTAIDHYPPTKVPLSLLLELARHAPGDRWAENALVQAAHHRRETGALFESLISEKKQANLLVKLAANLGETDLPQTGKLLALCEDLELAARILRAMPTRPEEETLRPLILRARERSTKDAVWLTGLDSSIPPGDFWKLAETRPAVASTALEILMNRRGWKSQALDRWARLPGSVRDTILQTLSTSELLAALRAKQLDPAEIAVPRQAKLLNHPDAATKSAAIAIFGPGDERTRDEVARHFRPALNLEGDAGRGKPLFAARCLLCHELPGSRETNAGPPLASFTGLGEASLLENLVAPNREVAPQYRTWEVKTSDGTVHLGRLVRETETEITLQFQARASLTLKRDAVTSMKNLNTSLMPPGLEAGLSLQEMADLLAYLKQPLPEVP